MSKKGALLVNLGSPDSPSVGDVRRYLRQFLMDGRVLDIPYPIRFCVVNFAILPSRPKQSAEAYEKVWLPEGSPLVHTSKQVRVELQRRFEIPIELAMRYQNPSIESAVRSLSEKGVTDLFLIPLFPHFAMSSFETAVEEVKRWISRITPTMRLQVMEPFFDHPDFIKSLAAASEEYLARDYDHLLFSFHGLPERHLRKADPNQTHCLVANDCCAQPNIAHKTCYRAQCFKTVEAFVKTTGIPESKYSVAFQSRLGKEPWLKPYTDHEVVRLAKEGVKRMLVICPAFVSDCLETLEEIGMRARCDFRGAGGEDLTLIPCVNEHPLWIDSLAKWIDAFRQGPARDTSNA